MSKTFAVVTLGCKTNQFESAAMVEQLEQSGYRQIDFAQGAELVVVNTCTVTAATDTQSRNLIRRAKRMNPESRIVVTGCYAQIDPQSLSRLPGVSLIIGNQEKATLLTHLEQQQAEGEIRVADISNRLTAEPLQLTGFNQRSRAFVQIQNGCDAFCSYCIIPYARGRSRSVATSEVVEQIAKLSAAGYPEVVLTGIHIGQYGLDLMPKTDLLELLRRIEISGFSGRLRLGSIEPTELSTELLTYISEAEWICPHFHIPLQSGDDDILKGMNRHYSTEFFARLLEHIRQLQPDAAIGLDVITGFPGETDLQFTKTCQYLECLPFTHLHVFPFSRRSGTPAAEMKGQLPGDIIKARAAQLREIGERKLTVYADRFIGQVLQVVVEGGEMDGLKKGLSQNYLQVQLAAGGLEQGSLLPVEIYSSRSGILSGNLFSGRDC